MMSVAAEKAGDPELKKKLDSMLAKLGGQAVRIGGGGGGICVYVRVVLWIHHLCAHKMKHFRAC